MPNDLIPTGGSTPLDPVRGTLPVGQREMLAYISQMSQGETLDSDDMVGKEFPVKEWLIHPVELTDDHTGEVYTTSRLVLSDGQGHNLASCSSGVINSWSIVTNLIGNGPYDPPVVISLREGKSRKGLKFRTLVVLG